MTTSERNQAAATQVTGDPRWIAIVNRDGAAEGSFYFSVKTTGIYCRPSCAARLPRPENVQFHTTPNEAEKAGFRACKRCKPDGASRTEQHAAAVAKICRLIENSEEIPALTKLAEAADMSPYHFHRVFKMVTGVTPTAFAAAKRAGRVREKLGASATVTEAIYDAGFNSNGRFYATSDNVLGMTPTEFRAGGARREIHFAVGECSLGSILVAKSEKGVCAILLGDDPAHLVKDLEDRFPRATLLGGEGDFEGMIAKVVGMVEQPALGLDLPLDIRGTAFQQRVWQALQRIPSGTTVSYTDIAGQIGMPKAVRAVAQACGANALAVAIPCHRVVRSDGALSGYRWGIDRKRALLEREAGA